MRDTLVFGTDSKEVRRECIDADAIESRATLPPKQEEGEVNALSKGNGYGNQSYHK